MLGDRTPAELLHAAATAGNRSHLMLEERQRANFFRYDALADPRQAYPNIRWHKLTTSGLWVSYGELNALPDYLPDPGSIDTLPLETMLPIVQKMRQVVVKNTSESLGLGKGRLSGQASPGMAGVLPDKAADVIALQGVTENHGVNVAHKGLLARNACHFAPHSWHRWEQYHNEAVGLGSRAFQAKKEGTESSQKLEHLAWISNGYADHFLQDSFAAGHLINKTLIMQWFLEYAQKNAFWMKGLPSSEVFAGMTTKAQPDLGGGADAYSKKLTSTRTTRDDRMSGDSIVDPQTAHERLRRDGRIAGSGVRGKDAADRKKKYELSLEFLNNAFIQMGPLEVHNYFNERGLAVENDRGDRFAVGGDATLLTASGPIGLEVAATAAERSRQAIQQAISVGQPGEEHTTEAIAQLIPRKVLQLEKGGDAKAALDIPTWHDQIRPLCEAEIFPEILRYFTSKNIVRAVSPEMMSGGISQDSVR